MTSDLDDLADLETFLAATPDSKHTRRIRSGKQHAARVLKGVQDRRSKGGWRVQLRYYRQRKIKGPKNHLPE